MINKQFDLFQLNRVQYIGRVQQEKKSKSKLESDFKPQISDKTKNIALQYRQKLALQINEENFNTLDWITQTGNKEEWVEYAKQILDAENMKECTFQPSISKNSRALSSSRCASIGKSMDKREELYLMGKKQGKKTDKSREEYEYEKSKSECTFSPHIGKYLKEQKKDTKVMENKYVQKGVERMKKARDEKERVQKYTERGIILTSPERRPMTTTNKQSTHFKFNDVTSPSKQTESYATLKPPQTKPNPKKASTKSMLKADPPCKNKNMPIISPKE